MLLLATTFLARFKNLVEFIFTDLKTDIQMKINARKYWRWVVFLTILMHYFCCLNLHTVIFYDIIYKVNRMLGNDSPYTFVNINNSLK